MMIMMMMMMMMIRPLLIHKNTCEQSINKVKRWQGKSTYDRRNVTEQFYTRRNQQSI